MNKKLLFTISFLFVFIIGLKAQQQVVTGVITSNEDNFGLPGVSIVIKGTTNGTVTDINGKYSLAGVSPTDTLHISYVGYSPKDVAVGNQNVINVVLEVSVSELGEVVVTALGVKRQQRAIGYSTQKIDVAQVVQSNTPNILDALEGRSAGVNISQGDGIDGGSTRIVIRGNNNFDGKNQPLIVVDNVPMENNPGLENIGRGTDWGSGIGDINPMDIADYTVLKGGAASALYGSRGANGVILITTKRGNKRDGLGITYNFSHKIIHPYKFREVQNKYGAGGPISFTPPTFPTDGDTLLYPGIYGTDNLIINQAGETSSSSEEFGYYGSAVSWGPEMNGELVRWWDGKMREYSPQPDNYKSVFHNGYTQTHNIAASGGGDYGTIRVSITRQDHEAIIDNSNYDRTTINLGSNIKISDKIRADITMSYINYNRLNSPMLGEDANSFSKGFLYSWPRSYQGIDRENYALEDGSQNPLDGYPFLYINQNVWWNLYNNNTTQKRDKYMGAITLTYDITSWLNIRGRVGRDFTLEQFESRNKPIDVIGLQEGYYGKSLSRSYSDIFEGFLTAGKQNLFNSKFSGEVVIGASRWNSDYYKISGHSGKWYYPNMYMFGNYTETIYTTDEYGNTIIDRAGDNLSEVAAGETTIRERNNSIFSFVNLSYDDYLFVELTGRNDFSSTLPPGSNSYFYPSASVSFIASEAFNLQESVEWFNFLKVRAAIAQTATDTEPYQLAFKYITELQGGQQASYFNDTIPPYLLTPQRVNAYEGGVNLGFFDNKIDFDFTYYHTYSYSQIIPGLPVPVSSGAGYITTNEGSLTNQGFEIVLNAVPIQTRNFVFKTGLNISRNRSHIVSLGDYAEVYQLADIWGLNGPAMALRAGDEYGTIYGYDYVYHENGQPIVNDEGTKYEITDTRVPIGNASPDFLGGWYTEFNYKGFRLGTLIDTKWGGDIYCGSYVIGLQSGQSPETLVERDGGGLPYTDPAGNTSNIGIILDGVYADGTPNDKVVHYYYKYLPNAGGWGKLLSTPGIVENTWVKMREISLSYTFPVEMIRKTGIFQNLTLSIVGRDLFYIYTTLPDNINPEGIMGSGNAQGFEWASMPSSRSFTFSLNASF